MQMGSVLLMTVWRTTRLTPVKDRSRQKGLSSSQGSFPTPPLPYLISYPYGKKIGADFCDLGILNEFVFYNIRYLCVNSLLIVPVVNSSPTLH